MDNIYERANGGTCGKFSANGNHEKIVLTFENCLSYM